MRNKVYLAMKAVKEPFDLQLFADGDEAGGGGANGGGAGEGDVTDGDGNKNDPPSFDDFLKGDGNQAEFDRRIQKAIDTAVTKAQQKWQALTDDKLSEAEKLAKMTKEEKAEYQRNKERQEFEAEKAAFEKEKLTVEIKSDLQKQGLPIAFAESLAVIGDADKIKDALGSIKEAWDAEIAEAIKSKARQTTPKQGGYGPGPGSTPDVGSMAKAARIIK